MIAAIELQLVLERQIAAEAIEAFPRECCGLVEGEIVGRVARVTALHRLPNLSNEADRFEIDPVQHIALLRRLRGSGRTIIGCYHSHPNGRAEPSERDRESAIEHDFLWLICALETAAQTASLAGFVSTGQAFEPVPIVAKAGTAPAKPRRSVA